MVTAWIEPVLIVTGLVTMGAIALFLLPKPGLKLFLGIDTTEPGILLIAGHWGLLVFLVGALLVYSAFAPVIRVPVLIVAIAEKAVGSALLLGLKPRPRWKCAIRWRYRHAHLYKKPLTGKKHRRLLSVD